ncbi:hypothetical protein N7523_004298 [Penicillium sp. IBT 18751x]|nr:hypothetical protein N7523_004298 [Penicillium sp. IBT 18751x]
MRVPSLSLPPWLLLSWRLRVSNEDLEVSLGGGVVIDKREQANEDLGIGLGIGASVTKRKPIASAL